MRNTRNVLGVRVPISDQSFASCIRGFNFQAAPILVEFKPPWSCPICGVWWCCRHQGGANSIVDVRKQ